MPVPPPAAPSKPAPPARPAPPDLSKIPTLKSIQIQFHTNNDDMDMDSHLTVTFLHNNSVFATVNPHYDQFTAGAFGERDDDFSDNRSTPWIDVPIQSPIQKDIIHQCFTNLRFDPNGHDTWRFNYFVQLHYSDGTMDQFNYDGHALSQDVRENTFPLK